MTYGSYYSSPETSTERKYPAPIKEQTYVQDTSSSKKKPKAQQKPMIDYPESAPKEQKRRKEHSGGYYH
ncbi:hypothetical protein MMC06_001522 [Schaereria dolodes]|nr:hypothetical protein [Schaereria dolodes]